MEMEVRKGYTSCMSAMVVVKNLESARKKPGTIQESDYSLLVSLRRTQNEVERVN